MEVGVLGVYASSPDPHASESSFAPSSTTRELTKLAKSIAGFSMTSEQQWHLSMEGKRHSECIVLACMNFEK